MIINKSVLANNAKISRVKIGDTDTVNKIKLMWGGGGFVIGVITSVLGSFIYENCIRDIFVHMK